MKWIVGLFWATALVAALGGCRTFSVLQVDPGASNAQADGGVRAACEKPTDAALSAGEPCGDTDTTLGAWRVTHSPAA